MECIILSVNDTYMDAQEVMHMTDYSKAPIPVYAPAEFIELLTETNEDQPE